MASNVRSNAAKRIVWIFALALMIFNLTAVGAQDAEPIKVGILHSLSGTMSISETTVRDSTLMAIEEINAAGGVLGRMIEPIVEDGASDWPTFAEKARKLLLEDEVSVIFGGWTSSSRKAMLPIVEENNGLLFYPVQYEGLEMSPNIIYTGATTNQQIVPAVEYLLEQGYKRFFLLGREYPRHHIDHAQDAHRLTLYTEERNTREKADVLASNHLRVETKATMKET